jgi:hypothetical protein
MDNIYLSNQIIYLINVEGEKTFIDKYSTIMDDQTHLDTIIYLNKVTYN